MFATTEGLSKEAFKIFEVTGNIIQTSGGEKYMYFPGFILKDAEGRYFITTNIDDLPKGIREDVLKEKVIEGVSAQIKLERL